MELHNGDSASERMIKKKEQEREIQEDFSV